MGKLWKAVKKEIKRHLNDRKLQQMQADLAKKQIKESGISEESIYATLLALVQDSNVEEVFMILHNVASDTGVRRILEKQYKKSKSWKW